MREIKFSAWAKHQNKMYGPEEMSSDGIAIDPNNRGIANIHGGNNSLNQYDDHNKFISEQFTGLHDKNGKEIYEGDIVKTHQFGFANGGEIERETICGVKYFEDNTAFGFHPIGSDDLGYIEPALCSDEGIEIIGNIHENPELIK